MDMGSNERDYVHEGTINVASFSQIDELFLHHCPLLTTLEAMSAPGGDGVEGS